jgi:HSP20 family protein
MSNEIDKFFEEFFGAAYRPIRSTGFPVTDLYTESDKLVFEFALAGYKKEEINIETEDDKLTVFVDNEHINNKERVYYQSRIAKRNFKVSYAIPIQYDLSQIIASFEDGILKVILPKRLESMKKQIEVM